jgi:hypothetical protein
MAILFFTIRELLVLYMTPPPSHMRKTHTKQLNIKWLFGFCFFFGGSIFLHFGDAEEKEIFF